MSTWDIRNAGDTDVRQCMSREEAEEIVRFYRESGEHPNAEAFDRMAELLAAFPIGTKVRHASAPHLGTGEVTGGHRVYSYYPGAAGRPFLGDSLTVKFPGSIGDWCAPFLEVVQS
jgi:hypothetical protein